MAKPILDLKKLTDGMLFKDKAQLLISDHLIRCDSKDRKRLLTYAERDAIEKSILKCREGKMLDRILDIYNLTLWLMIDLRAAFLRFQAEEKTFSGVLISVILAGELTDAFAELEFELANGKDNAEKIRIRKIIEEVRTKNNEHKLFGHFSPTLDCDDAKPNAYIQVTFLNLSDAIKHYKKVEYKMRYSLEYAGIELLGEDMRNEIDRYNSQIEECISSSLESTADLYKLFWKDEFLKTGDILNKKFCAAIHDIHGFLQLNDTEREGVEKKFADLLGMVAIRST
jgi:hypothetical protein